MPTEPLASVGGLRFRPVAPTETPVPQTVVVPRDMSWVELSSWLYHDTAGALWLWRANKGQPGVDAALDYVPAGTTIKTLGDG